MPAPSLPGSKVKRLLRAGKSPAEVRRILEDEDGLVVTLQAVTMWRRRHMDVDTEPHKKHHELIPWTVRAEHLRKYPAMMLRLESRRRAGEELPPGKEAELDRWVKRLRDQQAVVTYLPEVEPGWHYVEKEPDEDLIRRP